MWCSFWSFSHLTIWVTFCWSEIRKEMRRTTVAVLQPTNAFRGKIESTFSNISTKQTPQEGPGPQVFSLKYGALSSTTKVKGNQNYFLKDIHNFVLCNVVQLNGVLKSSTPKFYLERNGYHGPPPRWDWEHRWCSSAQWHNDHALWSNQAKMRSLLVVLPKNEKVGIAWLKKKSEIKNCPASKIRNGLPEQVLDMFQEALRRWTR